MELERPDRQSKGQRTANRILDEAEALFARQGYAGTTLRQIAGAAGIREPGLYNHFGNKRALYDAVLHRALQPMVDGLAGRLATATDLRDYTDLPGVMTQLLLDNPQMAALLQQALQGETDTAGTHTLNKWLHHLFQQGIESTVRLGPEGPANRETMAINVIAMVNIVVGYFLSQRAFETLAGGRLTDQDNIARQKRLLHKVIRAMLIS
jgi:AcrR family transcriptional regulator